MRQIPRAYEHYRHFKGNSYQILNIAKHTETGELMVIYQALYGDFGIYARPLAMFMEKVDRERYPWAVQEYRFELIDSVESGSNEANESGQYPDAEEQPREAGGTSMPAEEAGRGQEASQAGLDPLLLEFLDADSYDMRLNILAALHHRITDDMINVMAMATDIEVEEGEVEERYSQLRACLLKLERFECSRLR